MRYSYEYKKKCVELYRQGKWPETPDGVKEKRFHDTVRIWVRTEDACGPEALQHKNQNKVWTAEEKYELVAKVLAGASNTEIATAAGINAGLLYQWVRCYKIKGYQGLVAQQKGRPPKEPAMKKKIVPAELTPSEREEVLLCQDFVQIKMRQFSAFNLPRAQPACAFFHTLVRTHPATYSCNDCEFVWCYRRLLDIQRSNDMPVYNREI